ncbi:MAG: TlpA disulfide reductase family protein [Bryobacteraceae bacterium]
MRPTVVAAVCAAVLAVSAAPAADIPRKPPDFAVDLGGGKQVKLSQYQGELVALLFILTTCPHCQAAIRCLIQEQNQFGARGFQALASAIEQDAPANVPAFVRQFQPPFPVGYNQLRPVQDFMQLPPMVGPRMPLVAFIDRQGIVRAQYGGNDAFFADDQMAKNIHLKIVELLNGGVPAKKAPAKKGG